MTDKEPSKLEIEAALCLWKALVNFRYAFRKDCRVQVCVVIRNDELSCHPVHAEVMTINEGNMLLCEYDEKVLVPDRAVG